MIFDRLLNSRPGIEPHVTLHHVDHPQILEDEYGGWLSLNMVYVSIVPPCILSTKLALILSQLVAYNNYCVINREDFTGFADICFKEFGDRVKFWTTINEANIFALGGFDEGGIAPGRCSYPFGSCPAGDSSIEPYIVGHHALLGHASVYKLYNEKYQVSK